MRKKNFRIFSFLLVLFLFIGGNSSIAQAKTASYTVPSGYNSACITTSLVAPRYGQTTEFMYLTSSRAREMARSIRGSNGSTFAEFLAGFKLPAPYSLIWGGGVVYNAMNNNSIATNIENLSEKGPVEIRVTKGNYGTSISSFAWNGKNIALDLVDSTVATETVEKVVYMIR